MKKAVVLSYIALAAMTVVLLDSSEGAVDFFEIVDRKTAEIFASERTTSGRSSPLHTAISGPRNNKYLKASMQIIRGMAEAKVRRTPPRSQTFNRMVNSIRKAVLDKDFPRARNMIGHLMSPECQCPPEQGRCRNSDLPRHCRRKPNKYNDVFKKLRKVLDENDLNTLLGKTGDASLIFVMDTTGSMGDEIDAAKKISKAIATYRRDSPPVNYILSPFGDPTWGNVVKSPNQRTFEIALDALTAEGGGNCPELTFNGIIDAIELGNPIPESPMFVFTDAGAKEGDSFKYTLDNALGLATKFFIPVNFFYSSQFGSCGPLHSQSSFMDLMDGTGGFGMEFNSSGEIQKMTMVMSAALDGTTTLLEGRSSEGLGRSRSMSDVSESAVDKRYIIPVDDTIELLIVTYTALHNSDLVELRNPNRLPQPRSEHLAKGGLWTIRGPSPGEWMLFLPAAVGTHEFEVQSSSRFNLQFDFFFLLKKEIGGEQLETPVDYPLLGDIATVVLIIPLKERLDLTSLSLSLVDASGSGLETANLTTPTLTGTFVPPLAPFKLKLSGTTAAGQPFQRFSRQFTIAKNLLLRRLQGLRSYSTLKCGRTLLLSFILDYNGEIGEYFDVIVNSSLVIKSAHNTSKPAIETIYKPILRATLQTPEVFFLVRLKTPKDVSEIRNQFVTIGVSVKRKSGDTGADTASYTDRFKITCSP